MASTGSSLDAENAGQNPDMVPIATEIPTPRMTFFMNKIIVNPAAVIPNVSR